MPNKDAVIKAMLSAFPSVESFSDFKENDREISRRAIPGILKFAFNHGVIDTAEESSFLAFLEKYAVAQNEVKLPPGITFPDVMDKLAGNLSVNALITQLEVTAREMALPEIQASMITRLKQNFVTNTPKKRALLRILAYKLSQKYPDLNWNYDLLLQLPASPDDRISLVHETAGVTITFHLQGQGEIIFPPDVAWLKHELSECIEYLQLENHISKKVIETVGATAFNLRSPKKPGPVDEPRLYNEAIRNALAISHQMAARWLLSDFSNLQKKLIIVMHAGILSEANPVIQRILETPLAGESGIYLTDFAHLCARYASVKVGFELYAKHAYPLTGHTGNLWLVNHFLSYSYYDYIPCLLEGKMLPCSTEEPSYEDFKRVLHFPEQAGQTMFGAIRAMHRFPQSVLLLTEIAKVLKARNMPFEADTVLGNLLLSHPFNLVARLMRMLIYSNVAQTQANFPSAKLAFERADAEGEFIVSCSQPESDIWHEIGVLNFSRALKYLQYLKDKNPAHRDIKIEDVIQYLEKAQNAFMKSMTVSATGKALNSLYMFGYTLCLLQLLPVDKKSAGKDKNAEARDVFKDVSTRVFRNIGWIRTDAASADHKLDKTFQNLFLTINLVIARYDNLVLCRSNIPHMKYMFALILWDFAPAISPQTCQLTLEWLKLSRREAEKLIKDNVSVYHVACGKISAEKFIEHVQNTIDVILKHVTEDELKQEKDLPQLRAKFAELSNIKLMLLELDRTQTEQIILCA